MRFNVKDSVKWIALSGMAITVTTGLINPSWAAAEQDSADAEVNVTQAVYGDTAIYKNAVVPLASVSADSLLDKYRDFSKFSTGDVSKDTKLALNIVSWQLPHGGFFKAMEKNYKSKWDGKAARSTWKSKDGVELGTFDNEATTTEIRFLADVYKKNKK